MKLRGKKLKLFFLEFSKERKKKEKGIIYMGGLLPVQSGRVRERPV